MMDMDDGYILWTGIWKGLCGWLDVTGQISIILKSALGHSKGSLNKLQKENPSVTSSVASRHRKISRIRTRSCPTHPSDPGWVPKDPGDVDAV